jgi:hypothetical protein
LHGSRCSTPRGKTQEQRLSPRHDAAATHYSACPSFRRKPKSSSTPEA